nr:MAG TPA_asm: hypothetical protein [Caudoviricetes sp.]DAU42749.1 MAG TPA: hypothetical protein [Caudoviricetes sp.]
MIISLQHFYFIIIPIIMYYVHLLFVFFII